MKEEQRANPSAFVTNRTLRIEHFKEPIPGCYTFSVGKLLDRVRLACRARLINSYIVTREEYSIAGNNVARLK